MKTAKSFMRSVLLALFCGCIVLTAVACASDTDETSSTAASESVSESESLSESSSVSTDEVSEGSESSAESSVESNAESSVESSDESSTEESKEESKEESSEVSDETSDETSKDEEDMNYTYKHVIVIGVDGAGSWVREADTPCFDKIFEKGAVTYNALSSKPTISSSFPLAQFIFTD